MDIDDREALRQENERLRAEVAALRACGEPTHGAVSALLDRVAFAFFVLSPDLRFVDYRGGRLALVAPPEFFMGRRLGEIFPPDLTARFTAAIEAAHRGGDAVGVEYSLDTPGAESTHYVADYAPMAEGYTAVLVIDVTDRVRAEKALEASVRRFRALSEQATDVLYLLDAELYIRFWSPGAAEALGYTAEEAVGRFGPDFVHPDDFVGISPPDPAASPSLPLRLQYRVRHKDGSYRVLDAVVRNLLADPAVAAIVVNARDVTEAKRLEQRVAESQRLESIGRLAGGVAHDFNNLLTVILSCGELSLDSLSCGEAPAVEDIQEILAAGQRARELTSQLLAFARRQAIAPVALDLAGRVRDGERMLRRVLGEDIELRLDLGDAPALIRCDPTQLQQVLLNLTANARDALPRGGRLSIATARVEVAPDLCRAVAGLEPGPYIRLRVADNGPGLPDDVRAHLFEPFYTTKPAGTGTGLGLATVYGIVRQNGGTIDIVTAPGEGTRFDLYFPRLPDDSPLEGLVEATAASRGDESILLVEDEPAVGQVTARILGNAGYHVLYAQSGREALVLAGAALKIDLVLTDVVMPGMDGPQVAAAVAGPGGPHPRARVLFVSGYTHDRLDHHGIEEAGLGFLAKPFSGAVLLARVRAVLDAPG